MSVQIGDSVLLSIAQGGYIFLDCKAGRHFRLNKTQCKAEALISAQYGASFALDSDGGLVPATRESLHLMPTFARTSSGGEGCDNRDLNDNNKAQSLDATSIQAMKLRGESGVAIIEALTVGSATWNSKTEFSKAKWLKRKAKKYIPWVQIVEPTALAVTEAYFWRTASHGQTCRPDTVAQLLARSNIGAGSRVIVVDSFQGVILGGVAERTGPKGNILLLHEEPKASMGMIKKFNFSLFLRQTICIVPAGVCFAEALKLLAHEVITEPASNKPADYLPQTHFTTTINTAVPERQLGPHATCRAWFKHKAHALVTTGAARSHIII